MESSGRARSRQSRRGIGSAATSSVSTQELDPSEAWNAVRLRFQLECLDNQMICAPFLQGASFFRPWNAFVKMYRPRQPCLTPSAKQNTCFVPLGPVGMASSERTDRFDVKLDNTWSTILKDSYRTVITKKEGDVRREIDFEAEAIFRVGVPTIAPGELRVDLPRVAKMRDTEGHGVKKTPKSIFVIHESAYAERVRITYRTGRENVRVGEWRDVLVGFTLTKYHTKKDKVDEGWLNYPVQELTPANFKGYFLHPTNVNWIQQPQD